ncbi:MerR family transcriptional regulator [Glaciihabitans arcticus]|nr:MerR family transcriptional regulator [Glaciihabitans arcticus]
MAELSERSGVAVPTIKFYLREQLLASGERTSPNQAAYDESHVDRLRLVRALLDVGGLSVTAVRAVLAAIDNTELPLDWAFGIAQQALPAVLPDEDDAASARAIDDLIAERGWRIDPNNPGRATAARVLSRYESLGLGHLRQTAGEYLRAAEIVAAADLDSVIASPDRSTQVETVVVGTVLGDSLFAGLRRIAQEQRSHTLFDPTGSECEEAQ